MRPRRELLGEAAGNTLIGYAGLSKADGSQLLDLQRDALEAAGVRARAHLRGPRVGAERPPPRPHRMSESAPARQHAGSLEARPARPRSQLKHLADLVDTLRQAGAGLRVLAGAGAEIDTTTANGRLVFGIFASLAEFERELIAERTRARLAAARARPQRRTSP